MHGFLSEPVDKASAVQKTPASPIPCGLMKMKETPNILPLNAWPVLGLKPCGGAQALGRR